MMNILPHSRLAAHPMWAQFGPDLMIDIEQAQRHVSEGKIDVAIAILTNLLMKHQNPTLYRLLAKCYRAAHEPSEAAVMEEMASRLEHANAAD